MNITLGLCDNVKFKLSWPEAGFGGAGEREKWVCVLSVFGSCRVDPERKGEKTKQNTLEKQNDLSHCIVSFSLFRATEKKGVGNHLCTLMRLLYKLIFRTV